MAFFTPEDIEHYEFLLSVPGYNRAEVRAFLQALAAQVRETGDDVSERPVVSDVDTDRVATTERAIDDVVREAEIRMENAANRVVGEFEAVRAEVAQLLRALDHSAQNTRIVDSHRPTRPAAEPIAQEPLAELEDDEEADLLEEAVDVTAEEPEPTRLELPEPAEIPSDWDDLFAEPRMDPS